MRPDQVYLASKSEKGYDNGINQVIHWLEAIIYIIGNTKSTL
ncbi:MAG: hypothetical protein MAG795_00116 [Candidatus Woesearchaeota archaeon]|nr:hypothetical protein [Candidatus Woesearchaeota archaeon]